MAGLVAVIAEAPEARVSVDDLERLASAYTFLRGDSERTWVNAGDRGGAVLIGPSDESNARTRRENGSWAVHVGSVYADGSSTVEADAAELDGQFALVRYRSQHRQLEVLTDPFGLQALYIARRDGLAFVSTSALALARYLRARPSVHGLEVFLRTGPHFGQLTNWDGIDRVAPATAYSFGPRGNSTEVYWRPQVDRRVSALSLAAAARECVEVAVDAFQTRFASNNGHSAWCDLSGGYDTRLAALLLSRAGVRFAANTIGEPGTPDVSLAKRVAALGGWEWDLGQLPDDWPELCEKTFMSALAWGDGMLEATQLAEVLWLQRERAGAGTAIFNGGGGEHWRDYAWKQEMPFGGRRKRVNFERWVAVRFMHPIENSVFKVDPTPSARESVVERCRAYVAPYMGELNSVALDMLYAYKAMAHFGAYQSAARGTVRVELPFYAKPAFVAPFSVAPRHRNSHRLARVAIDALSHEIAVLPTTHGDLATPMRVRNAARFAPFFTNRARGAARKLTQHLPGPTLGALPERVPAGIVEARHRVLDAFTAQTQLDPAKMRSGPLYDAAGLRRLARSSTATTAGWRTLGRIITAERAMEATDAQLN